MKRRVNSIRRGPRSTEPSLVASVQSSMALRWCLALMMTACAETKTEPTRRLGDPSMMGPDAVANTTLTVEVSDRALIIEVWYPGDERADEPQSILNFEDSESGRNVLSELIQAAPAECITTTTQSLRDGVAAADLSALPLVIFSHCHNCGRYSSFSLAERLASHGMVVLSMDHAGPQPFTAEAAGEPLNVAQLQRRAADIQTLLEVALNGSLFARSEATRALTIDVNRIGLFGHSFGSVTVGLVAQNEPRVRAVAGLAAPMENILLPGVTISEISAPVLLVLAEEDNSILEIGNDFIRQNFESANPPVWQVDLADAGHWSVSDLCGLNEAFSAGCGKGTRHSADRAGEPFDYMPVTRGIRLTQNILAAFFLGYLNDRSDALESFGTLDEESDVRVHSKPSL